MNEKRLEEIRESAEQIVDSFTEVVEGLPSLKETYYNQDTINLLRRDGEPSSKEKRADFRKRFKKIMPGSDEEGNLRVGVAEWKE